MRQRLLPRGLSGMKEVPALEMLNDIRQVTKHDLSVLDKSAFMKKAGELTQGQFTSEQLNDAYNQLHLIVELGGSHKPIANLHQGAGGRYDIEWTYPDKDTVDLNDLRSRIRTADAMVSGTKMLPTQTNQAHIDDTVSAFRQFITPKSLSRIAQSGVREKPGTKTEAFAELLAQNLNDIGGGYDRYTRDAIVNQKREFGHFIPYELGGPDTASNGRMQAMGANHATGARQGQEGANSALGPTYQKNIRRFAGDIFTELGYNNNINKLL